jgi:hypothetical protein
VHDVGIEPGPRTLICTFVTTLTTPALIVGRDIKDDLATRSFPAMQEDFGRVVRRFVLLESAVSGPILKSRQE